jgi:peptidoglycan-associated lipoprotein
MVHQSLAALVLVPVLCVTSGCATKKQVRTEIGNVNAKVDSLTTAVEDTQERTRQNEARIGAVDQKAEAAARSAGDARAAADAAAARAAAVNARVDEIVAASRQLVYDVTLSEDQGNFTFGGADLPDGAKARLDEIVGRIKGDSRGVFIEIEGHTDDIGDKAANERLGLERAEAVKRYLYEQHQLPLHRISVISYGEDRPVASNTTREGRAQNRRVVIKVRDQPSAR